MLNIQIIPCHHFGKFNHALSLKYVILGFILSLQSLLFLRRPRVWWSFLWTWCIWSHVLSTVCCGKQICQTGTDLILRQLCHLTLILKPYNYRLSRDPDAFPWTVLPGLYSQSELRTFWQNKLFWSRNTAYCWLSHLIRKGLCRASRHPLTPLRRWYYTSSALVRVYCQATSQLYHCSDTKSGILI